MTNKNKIKNYNLIVANYSINLKLSSGLQSCFMKYEVKRTYSNFYILT